MANALYFTALFAAGTELWTYPKWQERTQYIVPPFATDATPALTGMSDHQISAVRAFSDRIHSITSFAQRVKRLAKGRDNDSEGRRAWNAWVKRAFLKWKIVQEIEAVLMEEERHPRQLIGRHGFDIKVPTMEQAGVSDVYSVIAERLFGEDAFRDRHVARPIVKDELNKFISTVVANVWNKMRSTVPKKYKQLHDGKNEVCAQFESFNKIKPGEKLDVSKMRKWYQNVDRLKVLATSFSDESALEELGKQTDRMNWVYKALTGDNSPAVIKGLSKNLREALKYMATHEDIALLRVQLAEQMERHKGNEGPIELDVERQDVMEWTEGVEHLKTKTVDELYDMLGFEDRRIPFLVTEVNVESDIGANPRTDEEEEDVSAATEVRATQPFSLRWHQLVGVTKMVERALTSGPIMLMDDVGLGKTLQVLAFFAVMAYYRRFYSKTKRYPGIWGTQEWINFAGKKATLPECPFLFVVPPMLVDQVASECNRFLERGSFDVIVYFAGHTSHKNMWVELEKRSSHSPYMRIYVASTTAIQSDSNFVHAPCIGTRVPKVKPSTPEEDTVFGRRYLAIAIDEAHAFRNPNKVYTSMLALREKTDLFVGMTATPVQTRPSDLWHIGKVAGLSGFKDDSRTNEELDDMKRSLARAKRDDKKALLERQAESRQALHRMFEGKNDEGLISAVNNAVDQNFRKENAKWMTVVREKYRGAVIRRTVNSLDHENKTISGLEPYEEHICLLKLYEHEYDALEALATKALDNASFPRQFSSENFYLSVRQCLFHPVFAIKNLYEDPNLLSTYEGYRTVPSCKLNTLVEIVHHHLSVDNAPGIEPSRHRPQEEFLTPPVTPSGTPASSPPGSPVLESQEGMAPEHGEVLSRTASMPDKIIVYCYFLTSFKLIQMVFEHHNIDVLMIDGKMKQRDRVSTLEKFKNSGRDGPRVLLISNVGSLGLNIAFANILIIMDVLWSVMSDQQLIGRVWRHPQRKKVHVYRLIGGRSPDVLLNNLSFSKGFIQEAFMNIGDSLRKALEQGDSDETLLDDDSGANEGGTAGSSVASTSKQKGKAAKEKQSKGKESDIRAPRARSKSRKQATPGGPSNVEAIGTGQTAGAAAARPLVGAEDDGASDGLRRMTLDSEKTPNEAGPRSQATTGASSTTPMKRTHVYPPAPKTIKDLPANLHDLEEALPKVGAIPVDSVESDDESMGAFGLSEKPDFLQWIQHQVHILKVHRKSITQYENADLWTQIEERKRMLTWYHSHYLRLSKVTASGPDGGEPEADASLDTLLDYVSDMMVDAPESAPPSEPVHDYEFSSQSSRPTSAPTTRSITPSAGSSASVQSKRSREVSADEGSKVSSQKRQKGSRAIGPKAVHLRRGRSGRSAPAQDEQFLTAQGHSSRPGSRQQSKSSRHRDIPGDTSESLRDLGEGEKGGKGKSRAL